MCRFKWYLTHHMFLCCCAFESTVVSVLIKPWLASVAAKCSCRYWCVSSSLKNSFTCFGKQQRQVQTYTVISANCCRTRTFLAIFLIERVSNYIELYEFDEFELVRCISVRNVRVRHRTKKFAFDINSQESQYNSKKHFQRNNKQRAALYVLEQYSGTSTTRSSF